MVCGVRENRKDSPVRKLSSRVDSFDDLASLMERNVSGIVVCHQREWDASLIADLETVNCQALQHFFDMGSKDLMWFEYRCQEPE